jgi:hypothetical protein
MGQTFQIERVVSPIDAALYNFTRPYAVFQIDAIGADISAGDTIEIKSADGLLYKGTHEILQVTRYNTIPDYKKAWIYVPTAPFLGNSTGTITVVKQSDVRPVFTPGEQIPWVTLTYFQAMSVSGKLQIVSATGASKFTEKDNIRILSRGGKYTGVHQYNRLLGWAGNENTAYIFDDVDFVGDDSGVLVYESQAAATMPVYDKPYIDTTTPVQTIVNPTAAPITVTVETPSGDTYKQIVAPNSSAPLPAPAEPTPAPVLNTKIAIIPQPTQPTIDYKALIAAKMEQIKSDPVFIKLIQDDYRNSLMGYTQSIATNAIKELKGAGQMPMNQYGNGIWGQADWVRANYPKDDYTAPSGRATIPPVIKPTDPNPGTTTPPVTNPGTTTPMVTNPGATAPPVTNPGATAPPAVTVPEPVEGETGLLENPLVKIGLAIAAIILIVKIFKNNKK